MCVFELVFLFSSDKYPGVELLDFIKLIFLLFEEPPYCFVFYFIIFKN